ncbi:aminotransferase class V-fold PLP-dependent enzyme [Lewinella sp. LCG006]|uniref:aminotransferase class V-fold PLP-dependent enzyme n=1 Tax=Lewinella sp. LCG006 TaxID=3231911 RepID=UPI00345FD82A
MSISPTQLHLLRQDTPACMDVIHFNNAGASLTPRPVQAAIQEHLLLEYQLGGYEAAAIHAEKSDAFYTAVAEMLHAQPRQIAFTNSATDAYNSALSSISFKPGDLILTTENDYASNQIAFLQLAKRFGASIKIAPESPAGGVDTEAMCQLIRDYQPHLVAVTHMPTSSGLIQDITSIGRACREVDTMYIVDACQTAGQLPLDVQAIGCDFLTATFRKFLRGPRGTGFLFASERILNSEMAPLFLDLHSAEWPSPDKYHPQTDARKFELWERNHALVQGAATAARYAQTIGLEAIAERSSFLAQELRAALQEHAGIQIMDRGENLGAIVTCYLPQQQPQALLTQLRQEKIHASISGIANAQYDLQRKNVPWVLRLSPHYYNTTEEIQILTKKIFKIIC